MCPAALYPRRACCSCRCRKREDWRRPLCSPHFGRGGSSSPSLLNKGGEEGNRFRTFFGVFWTLSFSGESAAEYALDSNFFMKICWKKLSPKNRKFRSSRGSETRRKLDSVKCFVGLDLTFLGCFWTLSFSCESAAEYAGNSGL